MHLFMTLCILYIFKPGQANAFANFFVINYNRNNTVHISSIKQFRLEIERSQCLDIEVEIYICENYNEVITEFQPTHKHQYIESTLIISAASTTKK